MPFCPRCWSEVAPGDGHCARCGLLAGGHGRPEWIDEPLVGRVLDGQWELLSRLGLGGTALVYRARDRRLDRDVAVKVLLPEHAKTVAARRFLEEARLASRLQSPHVVRIFAYGEDDADGRPDGGPNGGPGGEREGGRVIYTVMELLAGEPVGDVVARSGAQPASFVWELLLQVGEALEEAHGQGIVHRDVKPSNIFVLGQRSRPHFKLLDFGIARAVDGAPSEGGERLTATGLAVGTPAYMSPEQVTGARDLDGRSDLYSLGLVAYELLTGDLPIQGTTAREKMVSRLVNPLAPLREVLPSPALPDALYDVVDALVARDREERLPNAAALVERLASSPQAPPSRPVTLDLGAAPPPPSPLGNTTRDLRAAPRPEPDDSAAAGAAPGRARVESDVTSLAVPVEDEADADALALDLATHRQRRVWIAVTAGLLPLVAGATWWLASLPDEEAPPAPIADQLVSPPPPPALPSAAVEPAPVAPVASRGAPGVAAAEPAPAPSVWLTLPENLDRGRFLTGTVDGRTVRLAHVPKRPLAGTPVRVRVAADEAGRKEAAALVSASLRAAPARTHAAAEVPLASLGRGEAFFDATFTEDGRHHLTAVLEVEGGAVLSFTCDLCVGTTPCKKLRRDCVPEKTARGVAR